MPSPVQADSMALNANAWRGCARSPSRLRVPLLVLLARTTPCFTDDASACVCVRFLSLSLLLHLARRVTRRDMTKTYAALWLNFFFLKTRLTRGRLRESQRRKRRWPRGWMDRLPHRWSAWRTPQWPWNSLPGENSCTESLPRQGHGEALILAAFMMTRVHPTSVESCRTLHLLVASTTGIVV